MTGVFFCEVSSRILAREHRTVILASRLANPDRLHRHLSHRPLLPVSLTNERSRDALTVSKSSFARTSSPSRSIDHSNREEGIRTASVSAIILRLVGVSPDARMCTLCKWHAATSGATEALESDQYYTSCLAATLVSLYF